MKVELCNLSKFNVELSDKEILDNTKGIIFAIYNMIKQGKPSYTVYLFEDVFTVINSIHENSNYITFQLSTTDKFSSDLVNLLLSHKHKYLEVFNLVHIDENQLILPIKNKRQFYNLTKLLM